MTEGSRSTALYLASTNGHTEVVTQLLATRAHVNQANNEGATPLIAACGEGHTGIVAILLTANADVNQPSHNDIPIALACERGHLGVVQLLSSYGARRTFPSHDTAEHMATAAGHHDIANWLRSTPHWTPIDHLEVLTPERALALLRDGADIDAVAEPGGLTPLDRAKQLCSTGAADAGSAAHVVLEWGAPWSRQTHRFYPPAVRARVVEVLLRPCALFFSGKDDRKATEMVDAFEASLVKYVVASAEWR